MSLKYVNPEALNENIVKTKEHVETVRQGLDSAKQNKMQFSTMPTASADNLGLIVIYTGATSGSYTHGYVYECVSDGQDPATYSWVETPVQDEVAVDGITITRDQSTGQLSAVPATNSSKGIVQHGDGTEIGPDGEVNVVARLVVTSTMPAASEQLLGATRLFIGTSATYRTGGIYQCQSDGETTPTYSWVLISTAEVDLSDYRKTFLGTTAEWNAKTTAQKTVYDEADITDDLGGGMVVSTVPAEGDHNPIESEAVYNLGQELEDKADKVSSATDGNFAGLDANGNLTDSGSKASDFASSDIATTLVNYINENGAINQFDITLSNTKSVNTGGTWSGNEFTYRGLTYTVNADNIVITGTPTDNSFFYLLAKNIPAGRYTFGGLKDAANIIWDGGFWIYNGSVETAISTGAAGNKNDFTVDLSSYTFDRIKFGIKRKSNTLTNDTIKLFIRKPDINIDVNAPYAKTNRELTDDIATTNTNIDKIKKGTLDLDAIELTANTPKKVISSYGVYLITFTHGGAAPGGLYLAQVHATDVNGMQVAVIKESTDRTVTFDKSVVNQLTVTASGNGRMRIIKLDASNY